MKSIVFLFSILFTNFIYAQNVERPKQTKEKERLRKTLNTKIAEAKGELDPASFKYAILFAENPPIVELQEKYLKYHKYLVEYGKLLPLEETLPEDGILFNEIGEVFFAFNKFSQAEVVFNNALKILERYTQTRSADYAMTLNNIALLYTTTGRYTKAAVVGEQSRALHEEILPKESSPMAMSLNNLGVLYAKLGYFEEAENFFTEASRINEKALTRRSVAYALSINNLGMLMHAKGIEDEAEEMLIESQRLSKDILKESSVTYRRIMLNLVSMYNDIGRFQDAEVMCLKLIKVTENRVGAVHPDQAVLQNLLGMIYMNPAYNKKKEAEEAFQKAIAFVRKGMGERDMMVVRPGVNLGNLFRTEGKNQDAELILANVHDIAVEMLHETDEDYIASLESIGLLNWQRKKNIEAGKFLKSAVQSNLKALDNMFGIGPEPIRHHYLTTLNYNLQNFYAFTVNNSKSSLSLGSDALNYNLAASVLAYAGSRKNHLEIIDPDSKYKEDFLSWIDLKERLVWLNSTSKKYILEEGIDINVLEKEVITLNKSLPAAYKNFVQDYTPKYSDVRTIHQTLGKDDAIVSILKFPKFEKALTDTVEYGAFVLTKENASPRVMRIKGGSLLEKEYFQDYKKRLILKEKDEQSFQHYWGPVDEILKDKKEIFLSTEGVYNLINIKTLLKPTGMFVNQLYKIVQFASLNHLVNYKSKKAPATMHKALLIGFPDYGPKGIIPQLPGSLSEVENIKGLLDSNKITAEVLIQKEATEQTIKTKGVFDILHLASHASITSKRRGFNDRSFVKKSDLFYVDHLSSSGIFLSGAEKAIKDQWQNGILTSKEIQQLKFSTGSLVVLSQVDTWKQDVNYDDLANLQLAFKEAGGKSVLQSLWKTEDPIKLEFLTNFYQTYLTTKDSQRSYEIAVRMLSLKYPNPYDWGAFILIN